MYLVALWIDMPNTLSCEQAGRTIAHNVNNVDYDYPTLQKNATLQRALNIDND